MEGARQRRWIWVCVLAAVVLVGVGLRLPAVRAGYPYLAYVDEGHLLHPVRKLLLTGEWKANENNYPQLPVRAIAGAARLASLPLPGEATARLEAELRTVTGYSVIRPPELLLAARWLSLLLSAGIVVLVGVYARRLAGGAAGAVAALAAALLPALVLRGAIVTVDVFATFFVLAALVLVAGVKASRQWLRIAAAGAFCGLAAVSKYPAGLVGLAVVLELLLQPWRWSERLRAAAVAAAAGAAAALLAMPALVVEPREVWERMIWQRNMYAALRLGSYWDQVVHYAEWDLPAQSAELGVTFLALALAGLAVGVATRRWRRPALGWLLFGGLLVAVHARYAFQAFRNLLPLAALGCVAVALLVAWAGERVRRHRLVAATAGVLLVALFLRVDLVYARERRALVDSRSEAVEWLAGHGARGAGVLVVAETVVAQLDLARLGKPAEVRWEEARRHMLRARPRYLLVPDLGGEQGPLISAADNAALLDRYEVKATFGHQQGVLSSPYRGNRLRVQVLERRLGARRARGPSTAGCAPVGGDESVLAAGTTLVFGELHGTRESPAFVTALACAALQKGLAVTVALELPREEQKAVDSYLEAADEAAARDGLRQQPSWHAAMQFGITSAARLEQLGWLRAQRRGGAALRVVLFDLAVAAQRGAADRERRMAEALVTARRAAPADLLLVLVGNLHARRTVGTPFDAKLEPMALHLARALPSLPLLTFDASYPPGEAWICQPQPAGCGAVRVRGDGAPGAAFELVIRKTADGAYDGLYRLPSLTVSPPAFTP